MNETNVFESNLTPRKAEFLSPARVYCPAHIGVECFMLTLISVFTMFDYISATKAHVGLVSVGDVRLL